MEIVYLFKEQEMTPELQAHLIQRMADLAIQASLLLSEREQIRRRLEPDA